MTKGQGKSLDHERLGRGGKENMGHAVGGAADVAAGVAVSSVDFGRGFLRAAWGHPAGRFGRTARAGGGESVANRARGDAVAGSEGRGGPGDQRAAQGSRPAAD